MPNHIPRSEQMRSNPFVPYSIPIAPLACHLCGVRNIVLACVECARISGHTAILPELLNPLSLVQPELPIALQSPDLQLFHRTTQQETALYRHQMPAGNLADGVGQNSQELQLRRQTLQNFQCTQNEVLQICQQAHNQVLQICQQAQNELLRNFQQAQIELLQFRYQGLPQERRSRSQRRQPYRHQQRCAEGSLTVPGASPQQNVTSMPPHCYPVTLPSQRLNSVAKMSTSQTLPQHPQNPPAESADNMAAAPSFNATADSSRHSANDAAGSMRCDCPLPGVPKEVSDIFRSLEQLRSTMPLPDLDIQDSSHAGRPAISPLPTTSS